MTDTKELITLADAYATASSMSLAKPSLHYAKQAQDTKAALHKALESLTQRLSERDAEVERLKAGESMTKWVELLAERDALQAKLDAIEKQEPVAEFRNGLFGNGVYLIGGLAVTPPPAGTKLYATPTAQQPAQQAQPADPFTTRELVLMNEGHVHSKQFGLAQQAQPEPLTSEQFSEYFHPRIFSCSCGKNYSLPPKQQAQPEPSVPKGFALVPLRPTSAMEDVFQQDDWQWADVLAAAESVTEEQYLLALEDGEQAQPERAPLSDDAYEALVDDLESWSRHVVEDTAHITLDTHVRRTLAAHGLKQGGQHD